MPDFLQFFNEKDGALQNAVMRESVVQNQVTGTGQISD